MYTQAGHRKMDHVMFWTFQALIKAVEGGLTKAQQNTSHLSLEEAAFFDENESMKSLGLGGDIFKRLIQEFGNLYEIWDSHVQEGLFAREGTANNIDAEGGSFLTYPY